MKLARGFWSTMLALKENSRILVTRTDRIGDFILSTPVFKALREKFPKAHVAALTFLDNRLLAEGNPHLDEVILYDKKGTERSLLGQMRFAAEIRRKKFDYVIHLHATHRMHLMSWLAGIRVRIGWSRKCAWALSHPFTDIKAEGKRHEASYNFDLLKPLGIQEPESFETFVPWDEKWERSFRELIEHLGIPQNEPWIVLSPSASCPSKRWSPEKFSRLASELQSRRPGIFLVIGTAEDTALYERMRRSIDIPLWDLTGRIHLGELAVVLKRAELLISNDSGPVHMASALGTPVVSIFGRKQPGLSYTRWRPLGVRSSIVWKDVGCEKCLAHNCQIHFLCLDALSVKDVMEQVDTLNLCVGS